MLSKSVIMSVLTFFVIPVFAAPADKLNFSIGLSYENTDNFFLTPVNKINASILHTLLSASYLKDTARTKINFSLNADHQDYRNNTLPDHNFPNKTLVSSLLSLSTTLTKQRLFWEIDDKLDRVQTDQALANTITNQENVNYFTTGPKIIFFQNNKDSLDAEVKYEKFYTQASNSDYAGYFIDTTYLRNITRTTSLGLEVRHNDKKYSNTALNADYKRTDVTTKLTRILKLSKIEVDIGKTKINTTNTAGSDQNIFRLKYQYQFGQKTRLSAGYRRELTDFSNIFATNTAGGAIFTDVSSSIFLLKEGQFEILRNFSNSSIKYSYSDISNDYSNDLLDLAIQTSAIAFTNNITPYLSMKISASYRDIKYPSQNRNDIFRIYLFSLGETFLKSYDIVFTAQYINTGSTNSNYIFDERRYSLTGHYYFR